MAQEVAKIAPSNANSYKMLTLKGWNVISVVILVCLLAASCVNGDDDPSQLEVIKRDSLNFTIPNPFGDKPIFETNDQNGRYICLHIP